MLDEESQNCESRSVLKGRLSSTAFLRAPTSYVGALKIPNPSPRVQLFRKITQYLYLIYLNSTLYCGFTDIWDRWNKLDSRCDRPPFLFGQKILG